ncbi:Membrane frizzled-related protein-like 1, partial [Homarus americanus]
MISKVLVLMMGLGFSMGMPADKQVATNLVVDSDVDEYRRNPFFPVECDPLVTTSLLPGTSIVVESPRFPSYYPTLARCQWEISCAPRDTTYLKFDCPTFSLEPSVNCVKDRLIVTYKGNRTLYCGDATPDGTITYDGWTRLTFSSNGNIVNKGFNCRIWCFNNITTTIPTTNSTINTTSTTITTTNSTTPATTIPTTNSTTNTTSTTTTTTNSTTPATTIPTTNSTTNTTSTTITTNNSTTPATTIPTTNSTINTTSTTITTNNSTTPATTIPTTN